MFKEVMIFLTKALNCNIPCSLKLKSKPDEFWNLLYFLKRPISNREG